MTSVSLKISLEVVHLTATPLIHIYFYRIEIDKEGQCSGTFTLWFLVGYDYVELSSTLRRWSSLWFTGALLRAVSSCQQATGLAFCNILAFNYKFLDTCFKRLALALWTESRDALGMNDLLEENI